MDEERRIRLIVGNGFDINCGLKTKYADFFESAIFDKLAIKKWADLVLKEISQCQGNIFAINMKEPDFNIWSLFFYLCSSSIGRYPANDYYPSVKDIGLVTKESSKNGFVNWCDIENAMYHSLLMPKKDGPRETLPNGCEVPSWKNVKLAIDSLSSNDPKANSELTNTEKILFVYMSGTKELWSGSSFYPRLLDSLKGFENRFGSFIEQQVALRNDSFSVYNRIDRIIGPEHRFSKPDLVKMPLNVDSFNYSDPFPGLANVYHINGDTEKPIFGIDSKGIAPSSPEYLFSKTYRRLEYNDLRTETKPFSNFDVLYIYGHSLNEQDYSYFFPLFDFMGLPDITKTTKVVFAYSNYDVLGLTGDESLSFILSHLCSNVAGLFKAYEKYRNRTEEHRLLDILSFQRRLVLKKI